MHPVRLERERRMPRQPRTPPPKPLVALPIPPNLRGLSHELDCPNLTPTSRGVERVCSGPLMSLVVNSRTPPASCPRVRDIRDWTVRRPAILFLGWLYAALRRPAPAPRNV